MKIVFYLFIVLLIMVIFVGGIAIIEQEVRMDKLKKRVEETSSKVDATVKRANALMDAHEQALIETSSTSSELILE